MCSFQTPPVGRGDACGVIRYPTPAGSRHSDQASSNVVIAVINGAGRNLVARMARMPLIIRLATCSAFRFLTSHYSVVGVGGWLLLVRNDSPLPIIRLAACAAFRPLLRRGDSLRSNPIPHTSGEPSFRPSQ